MNQNFGVPELKSEGELPAFVTFQTFNLAQRPIKHFVCWQINENLQGGKGHVPHWKKKQMDQNLDAPDLK